jgi:acyl dehydratase
MLDYHAVKDWKFADRIHSYTERDTILYALGIGIGSDPLDRAQLRFVYEKDLLPAPTLATVLGLPGFWWRDPRTGADCLRLVHGEQHLSIVKPLSAAGTIVAKSRVLSVSDKGIDKGAIASVRRDIYDQASGELLACATSITFLRGDGGFSRHAGRDDPAPQPLPGVPQRTPDLEVDLATLPQQALLYRLSGDYNALHADPDVARAAGFQRPILHGLCTYGMAAHAVLQAVCSYDAARIESVAVRFTAPVYAGETLRFQLWKRDAGSYHLRARVDARAAIVLDCGVIELR